MQKVNLILTDDYSTSGKGGTGRDLSVLRSVVINGADSSSFRATMRGLEGIIRSDNVTVPNYRLLEYMLRSVLILKLYIRWMQSTWVRYR